MSRKKRLDKLAEETVNETQAHESGGKIVHIKQRSDLTSKQKHFLKMALDEQCKIMFLSGPAGTSKTYLSVLACLELMNFKLLQEIVYVRSIVESSENRMGFLPGDASEKLSPYLEPLMDKLGELLSVGETNKLLKEKRILGKPTGYLRGLNWCNKGIIVDETQNLTVKECITILTRIAAGSKIFLCGDSMQSDINGKTGFEPIYKLFDNEESREKGIYVFHFDEEDIVRSELVKYIVKKLQI